MITIDSREFQAHPELNDLLLIPFRVELLEAGDYAFLDRNSEVIGIEHSEIGNLIQKLHSGELEDQLIRCSNCFNQTILLVRGVYDAEGRMLSIYKKAEWERANKVLYVRNRVAPNTYYSSIQALLDRLSELGIQILHAADFPATVTTLEAIYKQRTSPEEAHRLFKTTRLLRIPTKLTSNPQVPRLMALCPRMPEKVAIRLIQRYDSIWAVLNQPDEALLDVEGLGQGLLKNLKEGVGKCQES